MSEMREQEVWFSLFFLRPAIKAMLSLLVLGDHCSSASLHQGALRNSRGELGKRPQQTVVHLKSKFPCHLCL